MGENKACTISCLQNCSCVHGTDNEKLTAPYMARPRAIELSMRLRTKKRKCIPSLPCFPLMGNVFHAAPQDNSTLFPPFIKPIPSSAHPTNACPLALWGSPQLPCGTLWSNLRWLQTLSLGKLRRMQPQVHRQ